MIGTDLEMIEVGIDAQMDLMQMGGGMPMGGNMQMQQQMMSVGGMSGLQMQQMQQ